MDDTSSSPDHARLCQTLAQARLAQPYAPRSANSAVYESDLAWFSRHKNPKRRWSIREMIGPEFETRQISLQPPSLWALVGELSPGFHVVSPVWRGSPFFRVSTFRYVSVANVSSDAEIAMILDECFRRGGVDQDAILRWQAAIRDAGEPQSVPRGPSWGR
jgi:hypothetical protein